MSESGKPRAGARREQKGPDASAGFHDPKDILQILMDYLPIGVSLVGPDLGLIACNARFKELLDFPDELFADGLPSLPALLRFNALRGEYGAGDPEEISARAIERARKMQAHVFKRVRPNGTVLEISGRPLSQGGFVTTYTDITEREQTENALRDSEAELRLLTDNVPAMILYVDRSMRCVFANKRYADFFGLVLADIVGKPLREIVGDAAYGNVQAHYRRALEGEPVTYQRMVTLAGGAQRCIEVKLVPRIAAQGQITGCYSMATDITEQKQTEQALRDSVEQLRIFADNVPSMTVSWDTDLRCRFANKRLAEYFGHAVESLPGKYISEVIGEAAFREVEHHFAQVLRGRATTYQRWRTSPGGELQYIEVRLLPHVAEDGAILGCYAVTADITEQKRAEERIRHLAHYDSLTELPNRLLFNDRLRQAIGFAKRDLRSFALLYLDLDRFKPVNDTLGHSAGDEILRAAAARIQELVRESDTVARVGGDEFTVILRDVDSRENVRTIAEKIVAALGRPFRLEGKQRSVDIGTSIGIALFPDDAQEHEALIRLADAAMYEAKKRGSCFHFTGIPNGTMHP